MALTRKAWIEGWIPSLLALLTVVGVTPAPAVDWPNFRGPTHDGVSAERINKHWTGPVTNAVWRVHLTNGITSLTVGSGRVFTQVGGDLLDLSPSFLARREYCVALSTATGEMLWATETEASENPLFPHGGVGYTDDGPRSTPVIHGDSVFVLSSYLKLYRLNLTNGAVIWQTNLPAGYGGTVISWQNAASPVIENGLVFVNANAPTGSLMAFNATNGSLVWRSQNEAMTQSTPVLATLNGMRQLIWATQSGLVSVDPQSGELLWKAAHPFGYNTSIGTSPVVHSNYVFLTANYSMSAYAVQIVVSNTIQVPVQRWVNTTQRSHWSTPVAFQGALYGNFYPDNADGQLRCVDLATGTTRWSTNYFGRSSVLLVGTNLLCLTERGSLVLVAASTNEYQELARMEVIPNYHPDHNKCWNAMALSDGQLYARSTAYAARFDLSMPDVKLDPPQFTADRKFNLTIRTVTGTPIDSNRLTHMEVRTSTNLANPVSAWSGVTNPLIVANGNVTITNLDGESARRFFIVSEPE